jgi:hypothetical protein
MNASPTAGWESLFSAELGAAAALLGLVFVGVSINISRIVASRLLVDRSLEAIVLLTQVLVVATVGLVPIQTFTSLGSETLVTGLLAWGALVFLRASRPSRWECCLQRSRRLSTPGYCWWRSCVERAEGYPTSRRNASTILQYSSRRS